MKIAIIGAGISGLVAAYRLQQNHEVTLFETASYLGGHTDTHQVNIENKPLNVDSGFIVFNQENYPNFCALLDELNVTSQDSDMSLSVNNLASNVQYNPKNFNSLFAQRRNLFRPSFYRMLHEIQKFYRLAPQLLQSQDDNLDIETYLDRHGFSHVFRNDHLYPMCCALWSGSLASIKKFPAAYLAAFMDNHKMLQVSSRPVWRTVTGGSAAYVSALEKKLQCDVYLNTPIHKVERSTLGAKLCFATKTKNFDKVIFACHSDQALALLDSPSQVETEILSGIKYQQNHMQLHTDASQVMPTKKYAWASWNVLLPESEQKQQSCCVTYYMNMLQNLSTETPILVSLNCAARINPESVILERHYAHPVYTQTTLASQQRRNEINGLNHSYYCGAYWGWGFHEDGVNSALDVVGKITAWSQLNAGQ